MTEVPVDDLLKRFADRNAVVAIVPLTGSTLDQVRDQWRAAYEAGADMVEWRLDFLDQTIDRESIELMGRALKSDFGLPVLATYRTTAEGGNFPVDTPENLSNYRLAVASTAAWADATDIECARPSVSDLIVFLTGSVTVVGSFHRFDGAGSLKKYQEWLTSIERMGVDVAKVAVIVEDEGEADAIIEGQIWANENLWIPSLLIGMGPGGQMTRLGEAAKRGAFTFATVGEASAPGQPTIKQLRDSLL